MVRNVLDTIVPPTLLLKSEAKPESLIDGPAEDEMTGENPKKDHGSIRCKACGRSITHERDRFTVQGAHQHTFANPHGLVFEIGCFRQAPGCVQSGPLQAEFTWFPGYQWAVLICAGCGMHLGWAFVSAGSRFSGLILARLVSAQ